MHVADAADQGAAEVITRARHGIVRLSGSWPHLDHFLRVGRAVNRPPVPAPTGETLCVWSPLPTPTPTPRSPRGGGESLP